MRPAVEPSRGAIEDAIQQAVHEGFHTLTKIRADGRPEVFVTKADGTSERPLQEWMRERGMLEPMPAADVFVASADGKTVVNVSRDAEAYDSDPAWSPGGTKLAYVSVGQMGYSGIYTVMADGSQRDLLNGGTGGRAPAWSPDGGRIAFAGRDGHLYVATVASSEVRRVTDLPPGGYYLRVSWAPDGERLAGVRSSGHDQWEVAIVRADGGGVEQVVPAASRAVAWTSDEHLIFIDRPRAGRSWFSIREYSGEPQACLRSVHRGVRGWLAPFNDLTAWALTTIARTPPLDSATTVLTESGAVAVDWAPGSP
jgi:dipeptidyl aminopeptidase/acylaminoacyl peptidase